MHDLHYVLAAGAGLIVGFTLTLVGGGGSILAVPLLVYVVGLRNAHLAIGTSAVSVAVNAATGLATKARTGLVKWRCAGVFTVTGVLGAFVGSYFGKRFDGQALLAIFALLMIGVGILMLRARSNAGEPLVRLNRDNLPRLIGYGLGTGVLSGFFGIGGGFLIVPGLMAATGMPIANAVASSLLSVTAFGITTASSYAWEGLVDYPVAAFFIAGGFAGNLVGLRASKRLGDHRVLLTMSFAGLIFVVAAYMLWKSATVLVH
jgi:uncharacterized membrane protein YfcA